MFIINILLAGGFFGTILGLTPIPQVRRCQEIEIHVIYSYVGPFAYFFVCVYEIDLFKVLKSKWM